MPTLHNQAPSQLTPPELKSLTKEQAEEIDALITYRILLYREALAAGGSHG